MQVILHTAKHYVELAVAEAPKKRPGRPRKPPADKMEQFSIRLSALERAQLEIFARYTNLSLSQAVGALIEENVPRYKIEGVGLIDEFTERFLEAGKSLAARVKQIEKQKGASAALEWLVDKQRQLQSTEQGKALTFPRALLTPEEKYFVEVAESLHEPVLSPLDVDGLYQMIRAMFNAGMPIEEAKTTARRYEEESLGLLRPVEGTNAK